MGGDLRQAMRSAVGLLCALAVLHCSSEVTSSKAEPTFHDILNKTLWGASSRRLDSGGSCASLLLQFTGVYMGSAGVRSRDSQMCRCSPQYPIHPHHDLLLRN